MMGMRIIPLLIAVLLPLLSQAQWVRHDVTDTLTSGYSVAGGDMDNDGDMDLVACSSGLLGPDEVHWYEQDNGAWIDHFLYAGIDGWDIEAADMDNDGDLDIICSGYSGGLVWWENDNATFTYHNIVYGAGGLAMAIDDINGDGLLDIATASTNYEILWVENLGGSWSEHILTNSLWGHGVAIGDISGDGELDVAGSGISENKLRWYENNYPNAWPETLMDDDYWYISDVGIADFDGNGYGDMVFTDSRYGLVRCYMHYGNGNFNQVDLSNNFSDGWVLAIGDIDNDGDPDVTAVSMWMGIRYWINNNGAFTQHNVAALFGTGRGINLADIDSDGDLDIVAVNEEGTIAWWEQPDAVQDPVEIFLSPHDPPINVDVGDAFRYDVHIVSHLPSPMNLYIWSEAVLENGTVVGPIDQYYVPFTPTTDITVTNIQQFVPWNAPEGTHQFRVSVGPNLQSPVVSSQFEVNVVLPNVVGGAQDWFSRGWDEFDVIMGEESTLTSLPTHFSVGDAYPNPFNASTRVSVTLPNSSHMTVQIFDNLGRQVAELANGQHSAGVHELTFAPSDMASGIYFMQVNAGGERAMQKLVHMK
jgi:Secretion system C-terminal sorting domain/FG-GAP-like repeat